MPLSTEAPMTWIVAGTGIMFPFMAGDVRVSWGHEREMDCLCKIYPVTRNILGGFAGSVSLGFRLLGRVRAETKEEDLFSLPRISYTWLPRVLRHQFRRAPEEERTLGCDVIMLGSHPELDRGLPGEPQAHVFTFKSPDFEPEQNVGLECLSIGSGNAHEHLRKAATALTQHEAFDKMVMAGAWAPAEMMASELFRTLKESPIPGVSPYFVYSTVSNIEFLIRPYARTVYEDAGPRYEGPPPLAVGPAQFAAFCNQNGLRAEAARAPS